MVQDDRAQSDSKDDDDDTSENETDRPLIIQSDDLLQGRKEMWIEHGDEMYRLRVTSAGKLYLTK